MARKIVFQLRAMTEQMLENWKMIDGNDIHAVRTQIDAFRAMCRERVKQILSIQPKAPIDFQELQRRLNNYLRQQLDEDMKNTELPPYAEHYDNDKFVGKYTVADACAECAKNTQSEIISGENYNEHYERAIIELTNKGILKPSEISDENAETIVKLFMIMRVKLDQIISARYNGDYTLEQQLCPPVVATTTFRQAENINNDERHQSILLSDLIEKYVQSNLNDGKWKSHSVVDHKSRITSLAIIIGDKHIDQFTRQDMRDFREILQKLPNNWRKIYNKHPTTIDKIIEQS